MWQECNGVKAKRFSGPEWRPGHGTRTLLFFIFLAKLLACSASKSRREDPSSDRALSAEEQDVSLFPHPKQPTPWETQVLLMTASQPPREDLQGCQSELARHSKLIQQEADMI